MDYSIFPTALFLSFVIHFLSQFAFVAIIIPAGITFPQAKCNCANQKQKSSHDVDFTHAWRYNLSLLLAHKIAAWVCKPWIFNPTVFRDRPLQKCLGPGSRWGFLAFEVFPCSSRKLTITLCLHSRLIISSNTTTDRSVSRMSQQRTQAFDQWSAAFFTYR